jgi:hypothetical protein
MTVTAKRKTAAVKNWLCLFSTFMLPAALEVPDLATSPEVGNSVRAGPVGEECGN